MALLQNDKAIFYHPLNDSTEFLQSQAWALGSGSLAGAGKISLALSGEAGDTLNAFGTQGEFVANDADHIKIAALSSTVVVVIYSNNSASQAGTAKVGTVSGTDITFGSATEFDTGDVDQTFVARVDATKCVVCWRDLTTGSVGFGRARIGTVTGTSIAFGTTATYLSANSASANSIAVLSTSLFVVCYQGPSATIRANAGAISGTTISFGAQGTIEGGGGTSSTWSVPLTATTFVVVYKNEGSSSHGTAKVGTVSGLDVTFGAAKVFNAATTTFISATGLSSTQFVVAYKDGITDFGDSYVGTVSGTDITFGTKHSFNAASFNNYINVAALSSTQFVVTYQDGADFSHGTAKVGTVSGTDITYGAEEEFLAANAVWNAVDALTTGKFVVAYKDNGGATGNANVGSIASGADLTASTPAAYATAAAATKVGFVGWLKNPSA